MIWLQFQGGKAAPKNSAITFGYHNVVEPQLRWGSTTGIILSSLAVTIKLGLTHLAVVAG